ncbi:MAG: hypothetical protein AB7O47_13195 [Flavobacteriales bacterium]
MRELIESNLTTKDIANEFIKIQKQNGANFFKIQTNQIKYSIVRNITPKSISIKDIQIYNSLNFIHPKTIKFHTKTLIFSYTDCLLKLYFQNQETMMINCKNNLIQINAGHSIKIKSINPSTNINLVLIILK